MTQSKLLGKIIRRHTKMIIIIIVLGLQNRGGGMPHPTFSVDNKKLPDKV
jgi:hypothetical protein